MARKYEPDSTEAAGNDICPTWTEIETGVGTLNIRALQPDGLVYLLPSSRATIRDGLLRCFMLEFQQNLFTSQRFIEIQINIDDAQRKIRALDWYHSPERIERAHGGRRDLFAKDAICAIANNIEFDRSGRVCLLNGLHQSHGSQQATIRRPGPPEVHNSIRSELARGKLSDQRSIVVFVLRAK